MSSSLMIKPIIQYPRTPQVGHQYLMSVDLFVPEGQVWVYEEEEYTVWCLVSSDLFSVETLDRPAIVLHRFDGSSGPIKFILKVPSTQKTEGSIDVTLSNQWGVPMDVINLSTSILP